jgi:translation initiation factor eIF-2B subunit alpha
VVESGGLVSRIGTSQCAYLARAMGKPFYALAESYKFLRYYPLTQSDLPMPKSWGRRIPLEFDQLDEEDEEDTARQSREEGQGRRGLSRANTTAPATPRRISLAEAASAGAGGQGNNIPGFDVRWEMTREMEEKNPLVDITSPELIDLVVTDLGSSES